jgi:hypothetical protein
MLPPDSVAGRDGQAGHPQQRRGGRDGFNHHRLPLKKNPQPQVLCAASLPCHARQISAAAAAATAAAAAASPCSHAVLACSRGPAPALPRENRLSQKWLIDMRNEEDRVKSRLQLPATSPATDAEQTQVSLYALLPRDSVSFCLCCFVLCARRVVFSPCAGCIGRQDCGCKLKTLLSMRTLK